jgi:hypothetical protein
MHNTTDTTNTGKPSRLKTILFAVIFMAIGSVVSNYIAASYYWTPKYNDAYRNGKIDQASEDSNKARARIDQENHRLADRVLGSTSSN